MIGGYLGSKLALQVPVPTLRRIFAAILVIVAVKMLT
jgi:uncharacterized membrane protein YfcA